MIKAGFDRSESTKEGASGVEWDWIGYGGVYGCRGFGYGEEVGWLLG